MTRILNYSKAVNEALHQAMGADSRTLCFGLGVPDPKGVFGTTVGLRERFGAERVFDMPASENAMTGVAIGAALAGWRTVMSHHRMDFFLLALDQLVNSAAKWHYTFNGRFKVPITIRLIIGRGWGQGPTHSQNLSAWFAHVPGLKVVMPARAQDAKGLLLASIFDDNPVVFIEHRWLHGLQGDVPEEAYRIDIGKAAILRAGGDVTVVSMSHMTVEALRAAESLSRQGVGCEVLDLRSIAPLDWQTIYASVRKTGRLLVLDPSCMTCSVSAEVVARVASECWSYLKTSPSRLAMPDFPVPTSVALTGGFYPRAEHVVTAIGKMMGRPLSNEDLRLREGEELDVPGAWFKGPF